MRADQVKATNRTQELLGIMTGEGTGVGELLKFKELEGKIRTLVEEYGQLRKKNLELEEQLKTRNAELQDAHGKLKGLHEERNAVRAKVDAMLGLMQDVQVVK